MLHTNRGELALLVDTFCRVWGAGGQATLTTTTKDGQVQANLELQLGHPADARPGAPGVQHRLSAGKSSAPPPGHPGAARRPRHRGPAARAKNRARAALHQAAKARADLAEAASASPAKGAPPSAPSAGPAGPPPPATLAEVAAVSPVEGAPPHAPLAGPAGPPSPINPSPVDGNRSEDVGEQTERVYKCMHLRCDATFKTMDEKVAHGKDWKKPSLKKAHSGTSYRSFADQGYELHEYT